jgi:hypothetical protein
MTKEETKITLTQEDLDAINKDIEDAKASLNPKKEEKTPTSADDLRDSIKQEILRELESKKKQEEEQSRIAREQKEAENAKRQAEEKINALKARIDEMAESKAVVDVRSPFKKEDENVEAIMNDPEKLAAIDAASRDEFFKKRG